MIEREFVGGREDKLASRPVGKRGYTGSNPGPPYLITIIRLPNGCYGVCYLLVVVQDTTISKACANLDCCLYSRRDFGSH